MKRSDFISRIKALEGYRNYIYLDSLGIPTVGYGHALHVGSTFPQEAIEALFEQDIAQVESDYATLDLELDPVREYAVKDILYNMGLTKFLKFKRFIKALREKRYKAASHHLLDSRYARQVPHRAIENSHMILTGTYRGG